jgi:4-alpha-glucanotransferase
MNYLNEEFWFAEIKIDKEKAEDFHYKYILQNPDGEIIPEGGTDRVIEIPELTIKEIHVIDTWNHAGEFENAFFTAPFADVLLKHGKPGAKGRNLKSHTHIFKVKAPLLRNDECICISGRAKNLNEWSTGQTVLCKKEGNWWVARLNLDEEVFPIAYKYAVYNKKEKRFIRYEAGDNRMLYADAQKKKLTILHDGFVRLPNNTWKGAGVSIPVFSLRSQQSFGVGEFNDLKLLADWAKSAGLKLIQVLPVNDTINNHNWNDSYPYAAISAFALHPLYINLEKVAGKKLASVLKPYATVKQQLNSLPDVDYPEVIKIKLAILKEIYQQSGKELLNTKTFSDFFSANKHWLIPYAAFCFLRDQYSTADFNKWHAYGVYKKKKIEKLTAEDSSVYSDIAFYYFVQYHLHSQLQEAADYLHKKGIVLKGDIPIGVNRHGADTWLDPELFHLNWQAGAPPDDFAVKGQNWSFPTYNWKKMQEDHFDWWRRRFEQMSNYFDAFRIDHILGFFRIWSIPVHAVEGIMGHFVPAIPVSVTEFGEKGIWFDQHRLCDAYITDQVLHEIFGDQSVSIKIDFLDATDFSTYKLKTEFNTQKKVTDFFTAREKNATTEYIREGLLYLISNVILFEEPGSKGQHYHFRFGMDKTISFRSLPIDQQYKLTQLYNDYFFRRQEVIWMKEAMHKLPYLKRSTNMLICGEDLGLVPHCVPEVMKQLGFLGLEIQRMPKKQGAEFFYPQEAPYLSVITPSTHDMSTVRGWWEEDREKITAFYNRVLGQEGEPPFYCDPWICRAIILQHLNSPAMWSIFQLQDLLGMSEKLRRENPHEERINVPANPANHWKYRMHLYLEDLIKETEFNDELRTYADHSGR